MHDPFTAETCFHPQAHAVHRGKNHRIVGDLNRDRHADDMFRIEDFYGRGIWKDNAHLTNEEKALAIEKFWAPFRDEIRKSFFEVRDMGHKKILFIDHHNTATDHPANRGQYLPPINLGNFGNRSGNLLEEPLSATPEVINAFQGYLREELPEIDIEMNAVYKGSSLVRFVRDEIAEEMAGSEINAIHLEYNLNLIFNPLSKEIDERAKRSLHEGINRGINALIENYFL